MGGRQLIVYGASGFGREVAWLAQMCGTYEIACFTDDDETKQGSILNDIPVMSLSEGRREFPRARLVGGVGTPGTRQAMMERASEAGFAFETVIHPKAEYSRHLRIGIGTVICAGTVLTTNIILGRHVQINLNCTVGHDAILDDYATLAPGVHVSGWVHLGRRVYVGTGAVLVHGTSASPLIVGDDAVIGAGACVTKSVPAGETWVGVPARPVAGR